jgi:hypothetical protein
MRFQASAALRSDARHFHHAQDIALLNRGEVAVAYTGNGQVKLFSAYPHALLAVWNSLGSPTRLAAGNGGLVWVLDAAAARIVSLDRDGHQHAALPGLAGPKALAAAPLGSVAVVDGTDIKLFPQSGSGPVTLGTVPNAACIVFGPNGRAYVGTTTDPQLRARRLWHVACDWRRRAWAARRDQSHSLAGWHNAARLGSAKRRRPRRALED